MVFIRQIRTALRAKKLQAQFEQLFDSPSAYRPRQIDRPLYADSTSALWGLGDVANDVGCTAGRRELLAVAMMRAVDAHQSYERGAEEDLQQIARGRIETVSGFRMRNWMARASCVPLRGACGGGLPNRSPRGDTGSFAGRVA